MLAKGVTPFQRSVDRQISLHQSRTPTERFCALCDLLDFARDMAPSDDAARERRARALASRQHDREQWREQCRRFIATEKVDAASRF
jgi:hypothetical protein